jgi:serine/threonine-protein kinase
VLYEMLAGHPPFNGDSAVEIALRHVQQPVPPLPPGTPASLERIVARALAKEPAERYQSAAEMADELASARTRARQTPGARPAPQRDGNSTWVAPPFTARHNVNPAARRRAIAVVGFAVAVLCAMLIAAIALTGRPTVRVPSLHGLTRGGVDARLHRVHLRADFVKWFSSAKLNTVVHQTPSAATRVKEGSTIQVALSKGPRPVSVPSLTGQPASAATDRLHRLNLKVDLNTVPAPGTAPGVVTGQSPRAGHELRPHATVTLLVAETPSWRSVTSFSGDAGGQSVPFKIRGSQWRIVYRMSYDGTCNFVFFCDGPSAHVVGTGAKSTDQTFDLNDGDSQAQVFKTGPGQYQIAIQPGSDSAHWSVTVEDWF